MIKFSNELVLKMHTLLINASGGADGVRDFGLLDSVLQSAYATFGGEELFPTDIEKAARICFGLVSNHAFIDGNKRIGVLYLLVFLRAIGIDLTATDEDIIALGLGLAEGKIDYEGLLIWINEHTR